MSGEGEERNARNQFGTFGGVFTPCLLTILGVIMYLRAGFVVGEAGVFKAVLILIIAKLITTLTTLSTSAIATNMTVRGGGAYYLISRVLGPDYGGAIGIVLFLAQALSIPFYVLGFTEAVVTTFPTLQPYAPAIAFTCAFLMLTMAYIGAGWALRAQYLIMSLLFASIIVFMGGALLRFSPHTFAANWHSHFTVIEPGKTGGPTYSFWTVFAIYFPAVTGIMAGLSMSGDLKNPARSIPAGTLAAVGTGFIVYLLQIILCAGAFPRKELISHPYQLLVENALLGTGFLVMAGMFAASLSSALGSCMGAPRVLQAVARDNILGFLKPFKRGTARGDEPRPALLLSGLLTFCVLAWAFISHGSNALNIVATLITEFFLYTYGMLNLAAFVEAVGGNPSFRPRFRWFHWSTALAGGIGCISVAVIIDPIQAVVALIVLSFLVWHIKQRRFQVTFGDARRGLVFAAVRDNLIRLSRMENSPKNWRPACLVFSGNPEHREALVTYAVWLEAGKGLVYLVNVLEGPREQYAPYRDTAIKQLDDFCKKEDLNAFPVVVVDENIDRAMSNVMQALRVGPIQPNLVIFGWPDNTRIVDSLRLASSLNMSLVFIHEGNRGLRTGRKRIDIWWRGTQNGSLMLLLAHLLSRNWEWADTTIRILRLVDTVEARESTYNALKSLLEESRFDATVRVVVSQDPFKTVLEKESGDADCIFLGFILPATSREAVWHARIQEFLCPGPTTILVHSAETEDILS